MIPTIHLQDLKSRYDAVVVGSGHNGLIGAAYLSKAGLSVLVVERQLHLGGATVSAKIFPDFDARLSRYSYLVSLLPQLILEELEIPFVTLRRRIASYTPYQRLDGSHHGLLLSNDDETVSQRSLRELTGSDQTWLDYQKFHQLQAAIANLVWPSLLEPLQSKESFKQRLVTSADVEAWNAFVEEPLGRVLEKYIADDVLRGVLMTDGKIGVLTHPHDETLLQNRCFLYHVIGQGTGEWRVPKGGMGALVEGLSVCAFRHGTEFCVDTVVEHIESGTDYHTLTLSNAKGDRAPIEAQRVLINAGPQAFRSMLGIATSNPRRREDEGSAVKVNMLLRRLPRLKAGCTAPQDAFCGSLHIDEGYLQMQASYSRAMQGFMPDPPPAEIYCHTLTDASILSEDLAQRGFHTLTLFGLDVPYRLFESDHEGRKAWLLDRYLDRIQNFCAEDFRECLARDREGKPCIEIKSPIDLEREMYLDFGNIFHNELSWFFAEDGSDWGKWGVETEFPRIYRCGSSALRGGAVSGIPGHNAAKCIFQELGID